MQLIKTKFIILFLIILNVSCLQAQNMYVRPMLGNQTTYPIANIKKITFNNGNLLVTPVNASQLVDSHNITGNRFISFNEYPNSTLRPIAYDQVFCNESATVADLIAIGTAIKWYTTPVGGTALATTTPLTLGTYYATQTQNNYESLIRTPVFVTANVPPPTTYSYHNLCGSYNPMISDFAPSASETVISGTNVKWYSTATGGTVLSESSSILPGSTYYASQSINNCESKTRAAVLVIDTGSVNPPIVSNQTVCSGATVSDLSATGTEVYWYTNHSFTPLSVDAVLTPGTYYATQILNGCFSDFSNTISVTVNTTPTPAPSASSQTLCNTATVANLVATGTDIKWYGASTGGTAIASTTALASGNYFVTQTLNSCESEIRTAVVVTLNATPAPIASSQTFCNNATVANLVATGTDIKWYGASTGGTAIASTTALASGNYFVTQTLNSCESEIRTAVVVTLNATPAPTASSQTFCNAAAVANLTATGTAIKWYTSASGGSSLSTTSALASRTYYATQSLGTCESEIRTEVVVTVNVTPPASASAQTFCNAATVANLTAAGTAIKWYTSASGGSALSTSTALASGSFYVTQTLGTCESEIRTAVVVTVNVTPPASASAQTFCNAATVANLTAAGTAIKWYTSASGGSALSTSTALASGSFYVTQTLGTCESETRTAVVVTLNVTPVPMSSSQTFSSSATVADLNATGTALKWYSSATGGSALALSSVLASGTYYVTQTLNNCESARVGVLVTVPALAITEQEIKQSFCVYPNPVKNVLNLSGNIVGQLINSIEIISLEGQLILQQKQINNNAPQINVSLLPQGMYLCKITSGNFTQIIKFLKQ